MHQLIRLLQQGQGAGEKIGALLGQHQLAGAALEERDPELLLQGVDGTGHGGGGLVEGAGGTGETARFHHLGQDADAIQHGFTFAINAKLLQVMTIF